MMYQMPRGAVVVASLALLDSGLPGGRRQRFERHRSVLLVAEGMCAHLLATDQLLRCGAGHALGGL